MSDPKTEKTKDEIEKERQAVRDYFGTAVIGGMFGAMADLVEVDVLDDDEVEEKSEQMHLHHD